MYQRTTPRSYCLDSNYVHVNHSSPLSFNCKSSRLTCVGFLNYDGYYAFTKSFFTTIRHNLIAYCSSNTLSTFLSAHCSVPLAFTFFTTSSTVWKRNETGRKERLSIPTRRGTSVSQTWQLLTTLNAPFSKCTLQFRIATNTITPPTGTQTFKLANAYNSI